MDKVYIGYQNGFPVRVERQREVIESDKFLVCDCIEEYEGLAELVNGKVLFDNEISEALSENVVRQAKQERAAEVEALTVEVEGMVFDADETSQARMSVAASSMTDDETNVWVLHDNTVVQVTKAQLLQACRLARIAQSAVWTKPYENASA